MRTIFVDIYCDIKSQSQFKQPISEFFEKTHFGSANIVENLRNVFLIFLFIELNRQDDLPKFGWFNDTIKKCGINFHFKLELETYCYLRALERIYIYNKFLFVYFFLFILYTNSCFTKRIGEKGIRTLGGVAPSTVFKTVAFNRSATSPNFT